MSTIKVTTLVENTVPPGLAPLLGELGLSFLIDTGEKKILFDAGQGLAILDNAQALGIDLSEIDTVVLSHGHFDHARGVKNLLGCNNKFTLVAHPEIFYNKMAGGGGNYFPIGISDDKAVLENSGIKILLDENSVEIAPGIRTTGKIPMETDFEEVEAMFFKGESGQEIPDKIEDDRALILDTEKGTVVIFGCAHRGSINTLNHVVQLTGNKKIHAVMGGLHLLFADDEKLKKVTACIRDFSIEKMVIGHCTGFKAMVSLVNEFGDKVIPNTVGNVIEF
jgi:7,8-dihydropterin-6-yl-methyl-4-(beta-D-ribofuranosyl)aminobenzene 5'-phosphate synthase